MGKKVKEEKRNISLNISTFEAKVEEDEDGTNDDSLKECEMGLFLKCYKKFIKRKFVKHFDKNLVKFRKFNPSTKWKDRKKEKRKLIYYECGESTHYNTTFPILNRHKRKQ